MAELPAALARHPELDRWVRLHRDGRLTVLTGKVELGQGITTALALIAAHEIGIDVASVDVQTAHTGITPNEVITAGSMSVEGSGSALRQACAHVRRFLLARAAEQLGMDVDGLDIVDGRITGPGLNQGPDIGELWGGRDFAVCAIHVVAERAPTAPPRRQPRLDLPAKVAGRGVFLQDLTWPDMRHARLVRPPTYRHRLQSLDEPDVAPGAEVRLLRDGSFLAVIGADEFAVVQHAERAAACCQWTQVEPLEGVPLGTTSQAFPIDAGQPLDRPVSTLAFKPHVQATYSRPHLLHGAIAPSAAAALWTNGALTVWTHSQSVELLKRTLAEDLDIGAEQVTVIHVQGAGAYGHNGADDAALDAALCAMAEPDRPVLLKWTRQQEHRWEPFGPAMRVDLAAELDADNRIDYWSHDVWSYTHAGRPMPGRSGTNLAGSWLRAAPRPRSPAQPRLDAEVGIHRNAWPLYAVPAPRVVKHFVAPGPLRTSSLRSLGAHCNVFAIESFMDELALAAGQSPVAFRLAHLLDPRARAVLKRVVHMCGGLETSGASIGRGLALAQYKNLQTYAAVVAEVKVDPESAAVRARRLWIVADAGRVVDPDGLINQLEGGAVQALSWTLKERVGFDAVDILSEDWNSYPVLRFDEVPDVVTELIDRPDQPSLGAGEATQGPTSAAVANAVFAATGIRVRDLPLDAASLRTAAAR